MDEPIHDSRFAIHDSGRACVAVRETPGSPVGRRRVWRSLTVALLTASNPVEPRRQPELLTVPNRDARIGKRECSRG